MTAKKILKVIIPLSDGGDIFRCDAIEYKGGIWLVPEWILNTTLGTQTPKRLIRVDMLRLERLDRSGLGDYLAPTLKISKALLDGLEEPQPPFEVLDGLDLQFQIPKSHLN